MDRTFFLNWAIDWTFILFFTAIALVLIIIIVAIVIVGTRSIIDLVKGNDREEHDRK